MAPEMKDQSTAESLRKTRTYGKFSVQNLVPLGRAGAKLKITTARYYLPSGASLHRSPDAETWGVDPDVPIRLVHKEIAKLYEMRREANLLGPPKPTEADQSDEEAKDGEAEDDADKDDEDETREDESQDDAAGKPEGEQDDDDGEEGEKPELPPLDQPDPNERPKSDPQLDAALLLMRVSLIEKSFPTHASADMAPEVETAKP